MHGRRRFLVGASVLAVAQAMGLAHAAGRWRIGYIVPGAAKDEAPYLVHFRNALQTLGYVEGQNLDIEFRHSGDRVEALPALAEELVRLKVDLIFAPSTASAQAAKGATATIPVVFIVSDPVGSGLVRTLARPGGNVTGVMDSGVAVTGKRLELLKELVPGLKRVVVLGYPKDTLWEPTWKEAQVAAHRLQIEVTPLVVETAAEMDRTFAKPVRGANGVLVAPQPFLWVHREKVVEWAKRAQLPAIYEFRQYVEEGGLLSYSAVIGGMYPKAVRQIDAILKGTKPAHIPVEQPTVFELVLNVKAARTIGLPIPESFRRRVDILVQ